MNIINILLFIVFFILIFLYFNFINKKTKKLLDQNEEILKKFSQILFLFNLFKNEKDIDKKISIFNNLREKLFEFQQNYYTKNFEKEINSIEKELYEFMLKNNLD